MASQLTFTQMEKALRTAGYRLTPQRRAILQYLASTRSHPSARQVFEEVGKMHHELSLATVYNTLGALLRTGLIKMLEFDVENRVEANVSYHINLVCTMCGRITDLEEDLPHSPQELSNKTGFHIVDYRLEYYGLCPECLEKERNSKVKETEFHPEE